MEKVTEALKVHKIQTFRRLHHRNKIASITLFKWSFNKPLQTNLKNKNKKQLKLSISKMLLKDQQKKLKNKTKNHLFQEIHSEAQFQDKCLYLHQ